MSRHIPTLAYTKYQKEKLVEFMQLCRLEKMFNLTVNQSEQHIIFDCLLSKEHIESYWLPSSNFDSKKSSKKASNTSCVTARYYLVSAWRGIGGSHHGPSVRSTALNDVSSERHPAVVFRSVPAEGDRVTHDPCHPDVGRSTWSGWKKNWYEMYFVVNVEPLF